MYFPVVSATQIERISPEGLAPLGMGTKDYICVNMKKYNHLSREQRYTIDRLLQQKKSYSFIAQTIGVSTSTVSREVKRNKTARGRYSCHAAHMYATERKEWRCYPRKFTDKMQEQVVQILREKQWSPEQIVGRFRLKGIPIVGKTTLYTFLHEDKALGGDLYQLTRHHLKYRRKSLAKPLKSQWEKRKGIDQRPQCINQEERFGDFEMDLIIGAKQQEAILTLTDRKTDYAIIEPLPKGKNAKALARVVNQKLNYFKRMGLLHSITTDNGAEFMAFSSIERALKIPVFFAKPYCSTDKPHIEHLNKLIRQYIPKGTSFSEISKLQIKTIQSLLNNRPRKKLNFQSPIEALDVYLQQRCT